MPDLNTGRRERIAAEAENTRLRHLVGELERQRDDAIQIAAAARGDGDPTGKALAWLARIAYQRDQDLKQTRQRLEVYADLLQAVAVRVAEYDRSRRRVVELATEGKQHTAYVRRLEDIIRTLGRNAEWLERKRGQLRDVLRDLAKAAAAYRATRSSDSADGGDLEAADAELDAASTAARKILREYQPVGASNTSGATR